MAKERIHSKSKPLSILRQQAEVVLSQEKKSAVKEHPDMYELLHELNVHQVELEMQNEELCRAQAELEASRNLYIDLYDFAPISYFTLDQYKNIVAVNFAGANLLGLERSRLYKKSLTDFIAFTSQEVVHQHIEQLLATRIKQVCEAEMLQKGGTRCYVQIESTLNRDELICIAMTDITVRRQTELKLIEVNKSLHLVNNLFQSASDAVAALDKEFCFIILNKAFKQAFSKLFATKIKPGMSLLNILVDFSAWQAKIMTACKQAFAGKETSLLTENGVEKNTAYYCYEIRFSPIHDEYAQSLGIMFLIRDITEYKLTERSRFKRQAELAHVAKMNTMGEMAAALAHEINQPLTTINAYSHGCLIKLQQGITEANELLTTLQQVALQAERAGEIIHRMKQFMREGTIYPEKVDINKLITDALVFLNYELDSNALAIRLELEEGLPELLLDRVQITQVILNLTRNSIEALQSKPIAKPEITIRTCLKEDQIEVHMLDNGPGIPAEIVDRILSSYFTTKPQGTGLGLAICRTLLEAHGGKLRVQANPAGGAWFQFLLPINPTHVYADS